MPHSIHDFQVGDRVLFDNNGYRAEGTVLDILPPYAVRVAFEGNNPPWTQSFDDSSRVGPDGLTIISSTVNIKQKPITKFWKTKGI